MLKLKLQYVGHLMRKTDSFARLSQVAESRVRLLSSCGARAELLLAVASLVA